MLSIRHLARSCIDIGTYEADIPPPYKKDETNNLRQHTSPIHPQDPSQAWFKRYHEPKVRTQLPAPGNPTPIGMCRPVYAA